MNNRDDVKQALNCYQDVSLRLIRLCSPVNEHRHGQELCEGKNRGKVPMECEWQKQAGQAWDEQSFALMERHEGNFGWPIPENFVAWDADSQESYDRFGKLFEAEGLKCWKQRSGRGGHFIFRQPSPGAIRNKVRRQFEGVTYDVRGVGGQLVVWPSIHWNGVQYEWETPPWDLPPEELSLLPQKFIDAATAPPVVSKNGTAGPLTDGCRNDSLFRLGCSMRRKGFDEAAIFAALQQHNTAHCSPALLEQEVRKTAKSAARYDPSPPDSESSAAWETPLPFQSHKLPSFPTEALPSWLRRFVESLATATQTPLDLAGLLTLAACALTCAKKIAVLVRYGWIEPLNLYGVAVLPPGCRKTAVVSAIEEPIIEREKELAAEIAPAIIDAETRYRIVAGRLQHVQNKASKATGADAQQLTQEAVAISQELAEIKIPVAPRLVTDDVTSERLATMLKEQDGHMAIVSAEGGIFDLMAGRYSGDGAPNFEIYLKAHAGDTIRVDRVGRPPDYIYRPALTMALAVQPEVLTGLVRKQGFRGRGLLGRILYAIPANMLGRRKVDAPPLPESVEEGYRQGLRRLLSLPFDKDEQGNIKSHLLRFSPEAAKRLREFEAWVEPKLAEFGELGHMTDWAGKLAGAVVRIGGLLHLTENLRAAAPWDVPVAPETLERAISIGEYLIPHARAAYACMGSDPAIDDAKRVLAWIRRERLESFSKRDIFQALRGYFKRVSQLEPALSALQEHGYIRIRATEPRPGAGRKPSPIYEVNPVWLTPEHNFEDSGNCEDEGGTPKSPDGHPKATSLELPSNFGDFENGDKKPLENPPLPINNGEAGAPQAVQYSHNPQNAVALEPDKGLFDEEDKLLGDCSPEDMENLKKIQRFFPGSRIVRRKNQ